MRSLTLTLQADASAAAAAAARQIVELVATKPNAILGLATGGTMEPVYEHLVRAHQAGLSFARVRTVNLDEYVGLSPDHPNSYHHYMALHLFDHIDLPAEQAFLPRGDLDPAAAARDYAAQLERLGPVDLQLLGIGPNGHIGFNEPGTPIDAPTRVVRLTRTTIEANARFFAPGQPVPAEAVTMGTAQILSARRLLALATGTAKASALAAALDGAVSADCPASYLRTHPSCAIIADVAAGAQLLPVTTQAAA